MRFAFVERFLKWPKAEFFLAFFAILALLFIFYPSFFLVRAAPLTGDHWEQHYPWAYLLSQSLRDWQLPFWTQAIHCGFPIAAESQIGIFYLPNLLLFKLLPFHAAYSWMNIVHFLLSGFGTYLFARSVSLKPPGALMAAVLFLFGAAFGGAYYNMTSLKAIAWFPLALFCFEKINQGVKKRYALLLGFSIGMSLIAGYLQVALFTWFAFSIYVFLRLTFFHSTEERKILPVLFQLFLAGLIAVFFAAPQTYLTFLLSMQSNRIGLGEDYAYVGSFSPFALMTLIDPVAQYIFRGNNLYCGLFSLFFILTACLTKEVRSQRFTRLFLVFGLITFLLAIGRWSPLYVGLIKLTHFYAFRVPAKFLGFLCFALALLAGIGFDYLWRQAFTNSNLKPLSQKIARSYLTGTLLFMAAAAAAYYFSTVGYDQAMAAGKFYVEKFIYGRAGHPRSLESYLTDLPSHLGVLRSLFNLTNFENSRTLLFILLGAGFAGQLWRKGLSRIWLICGVVFLSIDLYSYAWIDVKQDFDFYSRKTPVSSPFVRALEAEQKQGSLTRLYGMRRQGQSLPLAPSSNMLYGIEDIGAYSPLVTSRYYETIGLFGNVNDSTLAVSPDSEFVLARLPLLKSLGVSHILSRQILNSPELLLLSEDASQPVYLYKNKHPQEHAFFVTSVESFSSWADLKAVFMAPGFDPRKHLLLEAGQWKSKKMAPAENQKNIITQLAREDNGTSAWQIEAGRAGFFIIPETWFPGWRVKVNGKQRELIRAYGLFQAVFIQEPGIYKIEFSYHPFQPLLGVFKND